MQHQPKRIAKRNNSGTPIVKTWSIEITPECIETLQSKIQTNNNEDCGILFGSQVSEDKIRINSVSESCSIQTSARKCSCELDVTKANILIADEYEKSNHTRFYIGEWHTHPEDNPSPSSRDINSIKQSYAKNIIAIQNLIIMAIVGRKSICWKKYDGAKISEI